MNWLHDNAARFENPVILPPAVTLELHRPDMAKMVEGGINTQQAKVRTFWYHTSPARKLNECTYPAVPDFHLSRRPRLQDRQRDQ